MTKNKWPGRIPEGITFIMATDGYAWENSESGSMLYIFGVDSYDAWDSLCGKTQDERRDAFGVRNDSDYSYSIPPGALFYDYSVYLMHNHVVIEETCRGNW